MATWASRGDKPCANSRSGAVTLSFDGLHHHADPTLARWSRQSGSVQPQPLSGRRTDQGAGHGPRRRSAPFDRPQRRSDAIHREGKLPGCRSALHDQGHQMLGLLRARHQGQVVVQQHHTGCPRHGDLSGSVDQQCLSQTECDMRDESADHGDLGSGESQGVICPMQTQISPTLPRHDEGRPELITQAQRPHDVAEPVTGPTVAAGRLIQRGHQRVRGRQRGELVHVARAELVVQATAARPHPADPRRTRR